MPEPLALDRRPAVVVGIATHNRADILPRAIGSALDQSYRPLRVEIIDDASTDETSSLREEFPTVSWQRFDHVQGHIRARNRMMLSASESYYVSLDDDAWFLGGDEIAVAVEYLELHPNTAAIAFQIITPNEPDRKPRGAAKRKAAFIGCGHVLRLSVVKQLGGYSAFPGTYGCEETDLCLRIIDAGYDVVELDGVHVWHDKTLLARDLIRQYRSGVCNDLAVALRRVPLLILVPAMFWKIASHLAFAFKVDRLAACLQGIADFVCAAPALWRGRDVVRLTSIVRSRALSRVRAG